LNIEEGKVTKLTCPGGADCEELANEHDVIKVVPHLLEKVKLFRLYTVFHQKLTLSSSSSIVCFPITTKCERIQTHGGALNPAAVASPMGLPKIQGSNVTNATTFFVSIATTNGTR